MSFCTKCRSCVVATIEARMETFRVRGEDIEVETQVAVCSEYGEDLSVEELDRLTLEKAFQEYRPRHGLLSRDGGATPPTPRRPEGHIAL